MELIVTLHDTFSGVKLICGKVNLLCVISATNITRSV